MEYLSENYLLIATEAVYQISIILMLRVAYQLWNQIYSIKDRPLTKKKKLVPCYLKIKTHIFLVT